MTVYLLYMASPGIIYLLVDTFFKPFLIQPEQVKKAYLFLAGISMMLMIGLRSPLIGSGDTMFYYDHWETLSKSSFSQLKNYLLEIDLEAGYQITVWLLSHVFKNGQWLLLLSGAFMSASVCCFAYKNCQNLALALTAFSCLGLFNFMVQEVPS